MFNGIGNGWGMAFGGPFMIVFWILVILGIVVLVKWLVDQSSASRNSQDRAPLQILGERYARGEINREQYEQKRRDLTQ
jgi:putative membrane protein